MKDFIFWKYISRVAPPVHFIKINVKTAKQKCNTKMVKSEKNTLKLEQYKGVCAAWNLFKTHFSLGDYISVTFGKMPFIQK